MCPQRNSSRAPRYRWLRRSKIHLALVALLKVFRLHHRNIQYQIWAASMNRTCPSRRVLEMSLEGSRPSAMVMIPGVTGKRSMDGQGARATTLAVRQGQQKCRVRVQLREMNGEVAGVCMYRRSQSPNLVWIRIGKLPKSESGSPRRGL